MRLDVWAVRDRNYMLTRQVLIILSRLLEASASSWLLLLAVRQNRVRLCIFKNKETLKKGAFNKQYFLP
jgi:hypothetical protein